ncbi:hypothetical protein PUNSTDRAFT_138036 [Punctularia strigosozonata HHB-11173 SS5]|uniref:Uncharacterized protein n=1 Tax=Punctularia strigosozonata (strain HHB-11173) TaxID=741275 RepID=R7S4U1_PUNST|nr:uncharacterized protein PUNSTDRAFT_138036 [Punctularia strigosozonata HHB-11173 SS5]EIN04837.1 hypothetical protein PUNSTDRAFT_138036 [Punctularia strigosozonata HHB-11173 SS5]
MATTDVEYSSDSEWLDISSNNETGSDLETDLSDLDPEMESDRDRYLNTSRPLSRMSLASSSVDSERVDRWEGLVDDRLEMNDVATERKAPSNEHPVPCEPAVDQRQYEDVEDQRVKQALDQSMISTLSSRPHSLHSSLNDLRSSRSSARSSDLRLSFPDPLTSSRGSHASFGSFHDVAMPTMSQDDTDSPGLSTFDDEDDLTLNTIEFTSDAFSSDKEQANTLTILPSPKSSDIATRPLPVDSTYPVTSRKHVAFAFCKLALSDRRNVVTILTILSVVLGYIVNGTMNLQPSPTPTMTNQSSSTVSAAPASRPELNVSASTPSANAAGLIPSSLKEFALAVFNPQPSHIITSAAVPAGSSSGCTDAVSVRPFSSISVVPQTSSSLAVVKPSSGELSVVSEASTSLSVIGKPSSDLTVIPTRSSSLSLPYAMHTSVLEEEGPRQRGFGSDHLPRAQKNAKRLVNGFKARFWDQDTVQGAVIEAVGANMEELFQALEELANAIRRQARYITQEFAELRELSVVEAAVRVGKAGRKFVNAAWEDSKREVENIREATRHAKEVGMEMKEDFKQVLRMRHQRARDNAKKIVGTMKSRARRGVGNLRNRARAQARRTRLSERKVLAWA